ncbi:MAG: glycosyltransferase [Methanobacteriaceae archaeon]|nr:glycosyltransferase [Methanobacteriaceae archaeon]
MTMISVVSVYNNQKILEACLLKGLASQNHDYQLILIDNTHQKFKSASEALNHGADQAQGKYIIFAHQDVHLRSENFIQKLVEILDSLNHLGVAGIAGKRSNEKDIISKSTEGHPPHKIGRSFTTSLPVQTVDECLFIIPRAQFQLNHFDEEVCDGWHLYAVDYSLSVAKHGYKTYLIPLEVHHQSPGYSFTREYYTILKRLIRKHRKDQSWINTTTENWSTRWPLSLQINFKRLGWALTLLKKRLKKGISP